MASAPNAHMTIIQPRDLGALANWTFSQRRGSARPAAFGRPPAVHLYEEEKIQVLSASTFGYEATAPTRDCLYSGRTPLALVTQLRGEGSTWSGWKILYVGTGLVTRQ